MADSELIELLLDPESLLEVLNVDVSLEKTDCLPGNEASSNGGYDHPACGPSEPHEEYSNQEGVLRTRQRDSFCGVVLQRQEWRHHVRYPTGAKVPENL
jgi:hypothetical protein